MKSWSWSKILAHRKISTISFYSGWAAGTTFGHVITFLKEHAIHLKYLESLNIKDEIIDISIYGKQQLPSDFSKLKNLSLTMGEIDSEEYANLFEIVGNFSCLSMLHLNCRGDRFVTREIELLRESFVKSHPECQVILDF